MAVEKWIIKNRRNFGISSRFMGHLLDFSPKGYHNVEAEKDAVYSVFGDSDFEIINRAEWEAQRNTQVEVPVLVKTTQELTEDQAKELNNINEIQQVATLDFENYDFSIKETFPKRSNGKVVYTEEFKLMCLAYANKYGMTKTTQKANIKPATFYEWKKVYEGK